MILSEGIRVLHCEKSKQMSKKKTGSKPSSKPTKQGDKHVVKKYGEGGSVRGNSPKTPPKPKK